MKENLIGKFFPIKKKSVSLMLKKRQLNLQDENGLPGSTDIPFQDGPYKFNGLPGLIIKIEDKANSHSFVLKEVKNLKADEFWISENDHQRYQPLVILNQEKYKKQFIDYRNNPTKGMRQLMSRGGTVKFTDANGKELDTNKMMRDQEKRAKENNAKDNNLLELDLLQ